MEHDKTINPGLFVWEETENNFPQIISILWMGQNKRSEAKQLINHDHTKRRDQKQEKPIIRNKAVYARFEFLGKFLTTKSQEDYWFTIMVFNKEVPKLIYNWRHLLAAS